MTALMDEKVETVSRATTEIQGLIETKKRFHDSRKSISFSATSETENDGPQSKKLQYSRQECGDDVTDLHEVEFQPSYTSQPVIPGGYMELLTNNDIDNTAILSVSPEIPLLQNKEINKRGASTPFTPKAKRKRQNNDCVTFIKAELGKRYSEEELVSSRVNAGMRKFKEDVCEKKALSPGRLTTILQKARRMYKDEFEKIPNVNEVINSKCRKSSLKHKNKMQLEELFLRTASKNRE